MTTRPERLSLAQTPTPLQFLERTSAELGVELWIKRDDLTGSALSGNKVRKLEFLLAEAREQGADILITGGGEQSNHCRATAMAAARMGMECVVCLRIRDRSEPPALQGNSLLDHLAGARIRWIDHSDWQRRDPLFEEIAEELRANGKRPYVIPEGGSNAMGSWGYVAGAEELHGQLAELPDKTTTVIYACGSGGTGAGLILGTKRLGWSERGWGVAGVNVCDDAAYFHRKIQSISDRFCERFGSFEALDIGDIRVVDGHVGAGYAKSRPEELATLAAMVRREGIVLDPVYTGKAFHGMCQELAKDPTRFGERIVFLHTGGMFGLFSIADQLASTPTG